MGGLINPFGEYVPGVDCIAFTQTRPHRVRLSALIVRAVLSEVFGFPCSRELLESQAEHSGEFPGVCPRPFEQRIQNISRLLVAFNNRIATYAGHSLKYLLRKRTQVHSWSSQAGRLDSMLSVT